jgi:hypothetical protein
MSKSEIQEWRRLTVRLAKSLGQAVYINESLTVNLPHS